VEHITNKTISRRGAAFGSLQEFSGFGAEPRGFGKLNLFVALAVFALVSLLAGIQAGDINPAAFLPAGKASKNSKAGKAPLFLQQAETPAADAEGELPADAEGELPADAAAEVSKDPELAALPGLPEDPRSRLLAYRAFGLMDPMLAAERLQSLNDNDATMILATQKRRDLAYILEMADPERAAVWVSLLLQADARQPMLAPGESVLEQINNGLDPALDPAGTEDGVSLDVPPVDPAAVETVSLRPDFMLSPAERLAFLAEFPQYQTDIDKGTATSGIPVISEFLISD
jgi:hypothetical protein